MLVERIHGYLSRIRNDLLIWNSSRRREFYLMTAGFISDGKPVYDTLQVFEERWRAKRDQRADTAAAMMSDMRGSSGQAMRLGQAAVKWFPTTESMAIDAGEQSGDVAGGLRMAARLAETQSRVKSALIGEMVYPGFLLLMFVGFLVMVNTVVIPVFADIAPRNKWPSAPRYLGILSDNAVTLSMLLLAIIGAIFGAFRLSAGRWVGEGREFFDRWIPPWSVHRRITGAIMMSCFAAFIKAGIPFSAILQQLSSTASDWEKYHIDGMRSRMRRGVRDGDSMAGTLFDEEIQWEIGIYGGMTSFGKALESLSERVTTSVIAKIKAFASFLRMTIMFLVAGMIIWVYGSFFAITMAARKTAGM